MRGRVRLASMCRKLKKESIMSTICPKWGQTNHHHKISGEGKKEPSWVPSQSRVAGAGSFPFALLRKGNVFVSSGSNWESSWLGATHPNNDLYGLLYSDKQVIPGAFLPLSSSS